MDPEGPASARCRDSSRALFSSLTVLQESYKEVEDQDDEHLYRTLAWARELWIQGLGMPAMLPPSVEEEVKTAVGAARAKQERDVRGRHADSREI